MDNLLQTFTNRQNELYQAFIEHIQISLMSVIIAIIIAVPLAILIHKNKFISNLVLQISGIIQTIPSLAILGLLIPIFGIGRVPAIIALVLYAIFPILQNAVTGLDEIDPSLKEAATAFGMNRFEKLMKYELPLAMPVIVSGIRTSTVIIIGTATLAALIGAGGLGSFILLGIDRNNTSLILIGAISSALLAITFNFLIKWVEKKKLKTIFISFLALILALILSTLSFTMKSEKSIVVAGKLGPEPEILINMYEDLIESETDINVEIEPNFGKTTFLFEALKKGDIDIYPEFSGTIISSLLNEEVKVSNDKREVYEVARDKIREQDNLVFLEPMEFQNTYALAVPRKLAEENNLQKISDLKKIENQITAGFTLEFNDREDGMLGLEREYGLNLNVKTMEPALRYQAINSGDVNLIEVYSTDSEITQYDLVVLEDDKNMFPPYQGAALMKKELLDKYPEIKDAIEKISGKISEKEMSAMNYEVSVNGKSASEIAEKYLKEKGFIK